MAETMDARNLDRQQFMAGLIDGPPRKVVINLGLEDIRQALRDYVFKTYTQFQDCPNEISIYGPCNENLRLKFACVTCEAPNDFTLEGEEEG
jgi:hypothetical protein